MTGGRDRLLWGVALACAGLGVGLSVAGPLSPPAGPVGSTYKTLSEVEPRTAVQSLPGAADALHVISQPGSYYLTGNLIGESGKHGIRIDADHVSLDLNGFALVGVGGSLDGINAGSAFNTLENTSVRNGTVASWGRRGVNAEFSSNSRIADVRARGNGEIGIKAGFSASVPMGASVSGCAAQSNGQTGIHVENGTVSGCVATHNGERGIYATASAVDNCVASFNTGNGIEGSGSVAGCTAAGNGMDGIHFGGSVTGCRVSNNTGDGIDVTEASVVAECRASFNSGHGIYARDGSAVRGCAARQNQGQGIEVESSCVVEGNACDLNGLAGILAAGSHSRIDGNSASRNLTGIAASGAGNWIVRNSARANTGVNFNIAAGNDAGPVGMAATAGPWGNLSF